ncbi:HsdM family class I SAM-dependent methyltransferase [Butyrivibrio sp. VCB2001]|uniref:HsdM family class I SAM-dependent methyltransferase n=1 Tax=Butyrivibrio sp. VCB2001 TaxID=1280667 RepID=UPI0003FCB8F6|nr:N-6 DNA methylase [Butyrivibrio sp. VCB2001]
MHDVMSVEKFNWDIANRWRGAGMFGSQYIGSTLYVMCLKQMIETNACKNPERMPAIVELTKVLYRPVSTEDIEIIRNASEILEETYNVRRGLLSGVLDSFRSEENAWKKAFLDIVSMIADIVVDEDGYYPYAKQLICDSSKDRNTAEKVSSNAVADLLSIAANVQDGETVLDGTIGYGYSAINAVRGKKDVTLYGVDINTDSIQVATLYMILCGIRFDVMQEDFTAMDSAYVANKVIMDIPFGMRPMNDLVGYQLHRVNKWMDTDSCKEMECLFMASALDAMEDNGRIVLIVPQGILFKQTKALSTFRRNLVKEGLLKAVVSLPPVYNSTMISTAMLVLEHNNKDVLFVDATTLVKRERRNDAYITQEDKDKLHDILEGKKAVDGISFIIPNAEVLETGDWSISKYMDVEDSLELRSLSDINKELKQYYTRLDELNDESRSLALFS